MFAELTVDQNVVPSPVPTPSSPATQSPTSLIVHSIIHGLWLGATSSPLAAAVMIVAVLTALTGFVRTVLHPRVRRDPVRRFSREDKALIIRRAGGRCEHHARVVGRCRAIEGLEADHVHPHSRGGQTAVANGQALCKRHNRAKRASVPFFWQLNALAKRRTTYFPPHADAAVIRYAHRTRPQSSRPTSG